MIAILFDVRKAYDRLWHQNLLLRLKRLNFTDNIIAFIYNFITYKKMTTKVGNTYSSNHNTLKGCTCIEFKSEIYNTPHW